MYIPVNKKHKSNFYSDSVTKKDIGNESHFQFIDNRPELTVQRQVRIWADNNALSKNIAQLYAMSDAHIIQRFPFDNDGNDLGKPPQVRDIYSMARSVFGSFGSPQIKGIHNEMEKSKHPLLYERAGMLSGWQAGKRESQELAKLPRTGDWRDGVARHPMSMALRPLAASVAGGVLDYGYRREQIHKDPSIYDPSQNPFDPLF